jgi:uncharacterized protein (UPF0332 family)
MTPETYLLKAEHALNSARLLYEAGEPDNSVSRAYYAMHAAAAAALLSRGIRPPKRHTQLISQFSKAFVKDGPLPSRFGPIINGAEALRVRADYGEDPVNPMAVERVLNEAVEFVSTIRTWFAEQ